MIVTSPAAENHNNKGKGFVTDQELSRCIARLAIGHVDLQWQSHFLWFIPYVDYL